MAVSVIGDIEVTDPAAFHMRDLGGPLQTDSSEDRTEG